MEGPPIPKYIIDASVLVKWFSAAGEADVETSRKIFLQMHLGTIDLVAPDLLVYELANALIKSKKLSDFEINDILAAFYSYPVSIEPVNLSRIKSANVLAARYQITAYDAIYLALAKELSVPLVSANPRHHQPTSEVRVINLKDWSS